jgi:hypothetical protein
MRDYKEMQEVDLKLQLLSGGSIKVGNFEISQYLMKEIISYSYSTYMLNLQWLSLTVDDFIKSVLDLEKRIFLETEKSKLKTFDFYTKLGEQEMLEGLLQSIAMVFKTDDVRVIKEGVIAVDFVKNGILVENEEGLMVVNEERLEEVNEEELILIHRENFDSLVEAIKILNYLVKPLDVKNREDNPADEETRQLIEHMEKMRKIVDDKKKIQQQSDGTEDDIDISDIISAVTARSNSINKFNVWDLTLYQLYDEYARLELIDNYDFSIKAMMAGAEKIDLKHWSSKL